MNKAQLINEIAAGSKLSKADSKKALGALIKAVSTSLKKGDKIALVGFGSFSSSTRKARTGRNPQTGKPLQIKAKKVVRFKAGSALTSSIK